MGEHKQKDLVATGSIPRSAENLIGVSFSSVVLPEIGEFRISTVISKFNVQKLMGYGEPVPEVLELSFLPDP